MSSDAAPRLSRLRSYLPVLRDVWRMSLPIILTNLLQTSVNVADVFMVGRLGPISVAAVGMSQVLRTLMLVGLMSITTGSMVLVAQARGARVAYLRIIGFSQPLLAIATVSNGALRGAGDTLPGLYATLIGRWVLSVPLAYLLALRLGMGPSGVWWALAAGTALQATITLWRWAGRGWLRVALRQTSLWHEHLRDQPLEVRRRYLSEVRTPLMAIDGVVEEVDEAGVHYEKDGLDVNVRFRPGGFEVAKREG